MNSRQIVAEFNRDEPMLLSKCYRMARREFYGKKQLLSTHYTQHTPSGNDYIVNMRMTDLAGGFAFAFVAKLHTRHGLQYINVYCDKVLRIYGHAIERYAERMHISRDGAFFAFQAHFNGFTWGPDDGNISIPMEGGVAFASPEDGDPKLITIKTYVANDTLTDKQKDRRDSAIILAAINEVVPGNICSTNPISGMPRLLDIDR